MPRGSKNGQLQASMSRGSKNGQLQVLLSLQVGLNASHLGHQRRLYYPQSASIAEVIDSLYIRAEQLGAGTTMFCRQHGVEAEGGPDSSCALASFFGGFLAQQAAWVPVDRQATLLELSSQDSSGVIVLCLCTVGRAQASHKHLEPLPVIPQPRSPLKLSLEMPCGADSDTISTCDTIIIGSDVEKLTQPHTTVRPPPGLELAPRLASAESAADGSQRARKGIRNCAVPRHVDDHDRFYSP